MTCEMNNRIMEKYDNNGYLVYKGGYTGNVRDGFLANCRGQLFSYNGTVMMYDGDFVNGLKSGKGNLYRNSLPYFIGQCKDDDPNGMLLGLNSLLCQMVEVSWLPPRQRGLLITSQ